MGRSSCFMLLLFYQVHFILTPAWWTSTGAWPSFTTRHTQEVKCQFNFSQKKVGISSKSKTKHSSSIHRPVGAKKRGAIEIFPTFSRAESQFRKKLQCIPIDGQYIFIIGVAASGASIWIAYSHPHTSHLCLTLQRKFGNWVGKRKGTAGCKRIRREAGRPWVWWTKQPQLLILLKGCSPSPGGYFFLFFAAVYSAFLPLPSYFMRIFLLLYFILFSCFYFS